MELNERNSSTANPNAKPDNGGSSEKKRKNRKLKGTDTPTEREEKQMKRMDDFIINLPRGAFILIKNIAEFQSLLCLLLPFLRIAMWENLFFYLLGIISVYTNLTNKMIARCAGVSEKTVGKYRQMVISRTTPDVRRQRKKGGGRKRLSAKNPTIANEIIRYVEFRAYGPCTQGTQSYTAATLEGIQKYIERKFPGFTVSQTAIRNLLIEKGYRPRTNKKYLYGNQATETEAQRIIRHEQFEYIDQILSQIDDPTKIFASGDCKKKEILGDFSQKGKSWSKYGAPCNEHDFLIPLKVRTLKDENDLLQRKEGKAIPYAVYDIARNEAYFNVGITHDTAEFAANSIYKFWDDIKANHPQADMLYYFCDGGGSNSATHKDFKYQMARLSKRINMKICVIHYPPYRSKFNKIERKVFAPVSKKFERQPLVNLNLVLDILRNTTTKKGLKVKAELDTNSYELKQKPTDEQMNAIKIEYVGPTKNEKVKLSYIIDGRDLSDDLFPIEDNLKTVFDLTEDFDLTKEERDKLKQEKAQAKKEREARNAEKMAQEKLENNATGKAGRSSCNKTGSTRKNKNSTGKKSGTGGKKTATGNISGVSGKKGIDGNKSSVSEKKDAA